MLVPNFLNKVKNCSEKTNKLKTFAKSAKSRKLKIRIVLFPITFFENIYLSPFQRIWNQYKILPKKDVCGHIITSCKFEMNIFRNFSKSKKKFFLPIAIILPLSPN
jgi:hypothetical protein